jgi:hypothetical protein
VSAYATAILEQKDIEVLRAEVLRQKTRADEAEDKLKRLTAPKLPMRALHAMYS